MQIVAVLLVMLIYGLLMSINFSNKGVESKKKTQDLIDQFVEESPSLFRIEELGFSPLGRSPVVDVMLEDPYYMPAYADLVTAKIKKETGLFELLTSIWTASAIPLGQVELVGVPKNIPQEFKRHFDDETAAKLYGYWLSFIEVHHEVEYVLKVFSEDEKEWLRKNHRKFFSGELDPEKDYDFFTTEENHPLKFFNLGSKLDLARLADSARKLALISDKVHELNLNVKEDFFWEEQGLTLLVSPTSHGIHTHNADFFIDLGGHNAIRTHAGGTDGERVAALHIDFKGNNSYEGKQFVQGSGFLGVGLLISYGGNNVFQASSLSQGSGFFGIGILVNHAGNNQYHLDFGGQSFATFGFSLLWDKEGKNRYEATQGMAQAASSTLGVAFLIDNQGNNAFVDGQFGKGGTIAGGIGQGGSTGVRAFPWLNNPNLYGGLSFLYLGGGSNTMRTPWLGQGSAYFLSTAFLVSEGSNDLFEAQYDAQGQGLHSATGLLFKKGEFNQFKGGWGSIGTSGDRSMGMFINTGGHNYFEGADQSVGTSRKPCSIGVFVNYGGDNTFSFKKISSAKLQFPETPNQWSSALFLEVGKDNKYPENVDEFARGDNHIWGIEGKSLGISTDEEVTFPVHGKPKSSFPFDPKGWNNNIAYRPIVREDAKKLADEILTANYDRRRQIYEALSVIRFNDRKIDPDLSALLKKPAEKPTDVFLFGILWALRHKDSVDLTDIKEALRTGAIKDRYPRKMALALLGTYWTNDDVPILRDIMLHDPAPEIQYAAALILSMKSNDVAILKQGAASHSERVRYAIARGLTDSQLPEANEILTTLMKDPSFYVRRVAGLAALSIGNKEGMDAVVDTLQYDTLDTEDNYGMNIYKLLAEYLGVDFKLDKQAWINWWKENRDSFQFPARKRTAE